MIGRPCPWVDSEQELFELRQHQRRIGLPRSIQERTLMRNIHFRSIICKFRSTTYLDVKCTLEDLQTEPGAHLQLFLAGERGVGLKQIDALVEDHQEHAQKFRGL